MKKTEIKVIRYQVTDTFYVEVIKEGETFMNFKIKWSNQAGNCTLIIATDYDETGQEIKNFFLSFALYQLATLIK